MMYDYWKVSREEVQQMADCADTSSFDVLVISVLCKFSIDETRQRCLYLTPYKKEYFNYKGFRDTIFD